MQSINIIFSLMEYDIERGTFYERMLTYWEMIAASSFVRDARPCFLTFSITHKYSIYYFIIIVWLSFLNLFSFYDFQLVYNI